MAADPRKRMTIRLTMANARELIGDLSLLVARARGSRMKYLATLGLKAERAGFSLAGRDVRGGLVYPQGVPAAPAIPEDDDDTILREDPRHDQALNRMTLELLGMDR